MSKKQLELMLNILKRKWLALQEKEKQLIVQVNNPWSVLAPDDNCMLRQFTYSIAIKASQTFILFKIVNAQG